MSILPNILDVANHYNIEFSSKPVGNRAEEKRAICPFHSCSNHSEPRYHLYINTAKNTFNCFACDTKGGVAKFIALMEGKTETEVIDDIKKKNKPQNYRKKRHPAETLNAVHLRKLDYKYFKGWHHYKKVHKNNPRYLKTVMDDIWDQWKSYRQYQLEICFSFLLEGLMTGTYREHIELINQKSRELGVDFLTQVTKIYSQPKWPEWAHERRKLTAKLVYGDKYFKNNATTG